MTPSNSAPPPLRKVALNALWISIKLGVFVCLWQAEKATFVYAGF